MSFHIFFRIEPSTWEAANQAAEQYPSTGRWWADFPDWEIFPAGTVTFVPAAPSGNARHRAPIPDVRIERSRLPRHGSIALDLTQGIDGVSLDFAIWLANLLAAPPRNGRREEWYVDRDHELQLCFVFEDDVVRIGCPDDRYATMLVTPQATFESDVRRSLVALVGTILDRSPRLLTWSYFESLVSYVPPGRVLPERSTYWDSYPWGKNDPTPQPESLSPDTASRFRIESTIDDDAWPKVVADCHRIAPGSPEDLSGALFKDSPGWIRFIGRRLPWPACRIPAIYPYAPSEWHLRDDDLEHPDFIPYERGFSISIFAFAEFLGWLVETNCFANDRGVSFRDYHDPVHGFRLRFVHEGDAGMVSILSDRFIDRGYRLRMPSDALRSAAIAFLSSVQAAIRERAPALADLVSFRYARPPSGR